MSTKLESIAMNEQSSDHICCYLSYMLFYANDSFSILTLFGHGALSHWAGSRKCLRSFQRVFKQLWPNVVTFPKKLSLIAGSRDLTFPRQSGKVQSD